MNGPLFTSTGGGVGNMADAQAQAAVKSVRIAGISLLDE